MSDAGAARRWGYYPGCSLEASARDFDRSSRVVLEALGVDLVELPGWTCCGGSAAHMVDEVLAAALPARNLRIAEEHGLGEVVMPCPACSNHHLLANEALHDAELGAKVNATLDRPALGTSRVLNSVEMLAEAIEGLDPARLTRKVDLKVVCYYGCLLTRPFRYTGFDDAEEPVAMDRVVELIGATPLPWAFKTECCGASMAFAEKDAVLVNSHALLEHAIAAGAEAIVAACPLCQQNLDLRRAQINKRFDASFTLPVFYLTELVGAALGFGPQELGVDLHAVDAVALLTRATSPAEAAQAAPAAG